jgi:hypothetical protein
MVNLNQMVSKQTHRTCCFDSSKQKMPQIYFEWDENLSGFIQT